MKKSNIDNNSIITILQIGAYIAQGIYNLTKEYSDIEKTYDIKNFKIINERYRHDEVDIYTIFGKKINLNPYTFKEVLFDKKLEISYITDNKDSYVVKFDNKKIIYAKNIDFNTLQPLQNGYFKDKNYLYYDYKIIEGVNSTNVEIIDFNGKIFIKNDTTAYIVRESLNIQEIAGIDTSDFKIFELNGQIFIKSKTKLHYIDDNNKIREVEGINTTYFKILKIKGKTFIKSQNKVHYINEYGSLEEIKGLSPFGFQVIDKIFIRDKWRLFGFFAERGRGHRRSGMYSIIYGVNPDYFKIITSDEVSYDKKFNEGVFIDNQHVYTYNAYKPEKLENISPIGFQLLGGFFYKNSEKLYYFFDLGGAKEVFVDDLHSFNFISYGFYGDQFSIYKLHNDNLIKLEKIDRNSFKIIDENYIKDKKYVYQNSLHSENIDLVSYTPESFEKICENYYEDDKYFYMGTKIIEKNKHINYLYNIGDYKVLHGIDVIYIGKYQIETIENKELSLLPDGYYLGTENIYSYYNFYSESRYYKQATTSESGEERTRTTHHSGISIISFDSREGRELLIKYGKQSILEDYYKKMLELQSGF